MTRQDGDPIAFAGVWSVWGTGESPPAELLGDHRRRRGELALVHDRMPLALPSDRWADWLGDGRGPVDPAHAAERAAGGLPPLAGIELRPGGGSCR